MTGYVLDASAVLALLRGETGADRVAQAISDAVIGAANLAEVTGEMARVGNPDGAVRSVIAALALTVVAVDSEVALQAGLMRAQTDNFGLSLGDRLCLSLARNLQRPALTADRQWLAVAGLLGCEVELIR